MVSQHKRAHSKEGIFGGSLTCNVESGSILIFVLTLQALCVYIIFSGLGFLRVCEHVCLCIYGHILIFDELYCIILHSTVLYCIILLFLRRLFVF